MKAAPTPYRSRGQALAEFLIAASFVLVPLFLGVSLLAKYIDVKHAAVQAARYEAWEYTVWFNTDSSQRPEKLDNFGVVSGTPPTLPKKSVGDTHREARLRFFSDVSELGTGAIQDTDGQTGWRAATANSLWTDHRNNPLYNGAGALQTSTNRGTPTDPIIGPVLFFLLDAVNFVFGLFGTVLGLTGSQAAFTAINTDGYVTSSVTATVLNAPPLLYGLTLGGRQAGVITTNTVNLSGQAGVLSDAWNAGGLQHTYNQAAGTVPTVLLKELLKLPGIAQLWAVASFLAPELTPCKGGGTVSPWIAAAGAVQGTALQNSVPNMNDGKGLLWFGHIDIDAVHPDRLEYGGKHVCDEAGMCNFEYAALPPNRQPKDCIN
jgi:hypothetical protein